MKTLNIRSHACMRFLSLLNRQGFNILAAPTYPLDDITPFSFVAIFSQTYADLRHKASKAIAAALFSETAAADLHLRGALSARH